VRDPKCQTCFHYRYSVGCTQLTGDRPRDRCGYERQTITPDAVSFAVGALVAVFLVKVMGV